MIRIAREHAESSHEIAPPPIFLAVLAVFFLLGCDSGLTDLGTIERSAEREHAITGERRNLKANGLGHLITRDTLVLNPTGYTPLAAELRLETTHPVQVELEIVSPYEGEEHLVHRFEEIASSFTLPVLGLYASHRNTLRIRFYDRGNQFLGQEIRRVETPPLIPELPTIEVVVNTGQKKSGMNLVSFGGLMHRGEFPRTPFMFDQYGHIRWYVNMNTHPTLNRLFYGIAVERFQNGNLYFNDLSSGRFLIEMDLLGRVIQEWSLPGYELHHNLIELPSGNLLGLATKYGISTNQDYVLELDRETGIIVTEWDLRESLDVRRLIWSTNPIDWFHGNGLAYDEEQDAIIVSGRHQGTVKLTRENEVIWVLAPHRGWNHAGDGTDLKTKLLHPLDAKGRPITDLRVVTGHSNHPDFSWTWFQHAPKLTPQGTLFLFDNGNRRNYNYLSGRYSRAVEYRIDEEAMTIQQVWEYGRERGQATYAGAVSDVDYHPEEKTVAFMPGITKIENGLNGKMIEIDYMTKKVVYEAVLRNDDVFSYYHIFDRIERLPLYPHR